MSLKWQGRSFPTGERASDVLMAAVMTDVSSRVPPRDARVYAIVHEDNHRSLAVCRRHGLTEEMSRPHPSYRRIVTPLAALSISPGRAAEAGLERAGAVEGALLLTGCWR